MSLLLDSMEPFTIIDKTTIPDGRGGVVTKWTDGASIMASAQLKSSMERAIAQASGVKNDYFVMTPKSVLLRFHDVVRRESDGKVFRVLSDGDDMKTPISASLNARRVEAEEYTLNG